MSHDETVILDLVQDVDFTVREIPDAKVILDSWEEGAVVVNQQRDFEITVDLEGLGIIPDPDFGRFGIVSRVFIFGKSVLGKKKTYGRVAFNTNANIQTNGTVTINPGTRNLVQRAFTLGKAVLGKKTTFGQVSRGVTAAIQTAGINTIGGVDLYGSGAYGEGTYGTIFGPGTGVVSMPIGFGKSVAGNIPLKQTAVAEVSLASHGLPATRTDHRIRFRARTTTGSTGVLKVALYEGANNRSGELTSIPLTNTLTDYSLLIPVEAAETITSYTNLSIKFWGYVPSGQALVFEVSRIFLELPAQTGGSFTGVVSRATTFGKAVSGIVGSQKTATAEISLHSHGIPATRTDHKIRLRARTVVGSSGVIKAALYEGTHNRSGDLISDVLTNSLADYVLHILPDAAATITDYSNLSIKFWGFDIARGSLTFEISRIYLELPVSTGNTTQYGAIARATTFTKAVSGFATHFGAVGRPLTFVKSVAGVIVSSGTYYGTVSRTTTFGKSVAGKATHFAAVARATTFGSVVSATKKTFGVVARAITFGKAVSGVVDEKQTAIAEVSLASHGTPTVRTNHTIKVRARTTTGSTGVIVAELYEENFIEESGFGSPGFGGGEFGGGGYYEGSTLRSGDTPLTTSALTNSLADYSLPIPDANAATITDYSKLSIAFWGYDADGNALVFEVSRIYLELPTA